jgi:hypothetical protein
MKKLIVLLIGFYGLSGHALTLGPEDFDCDIMDWNNFAGRNYDVRVAAMGQIIQMCPFGDRIGANKKLVECLAAKKLALESKSAINISESSNCTFEVVPRGIVSPLVVTRLVDLEDKFEALEARLKAVEAKSK